MKPLEIFFLALAIVVGGAIFYYVILSPYSDVVTTAKPTLTITAPSSASPSESFDVEITASASEGKPIFFIYEGQTLERFCTEDPCTFTHTIQISTPGLRVLRAQVGTLMKNAQISIQLKQAVCLDGTPEGSCSQTLPLQCAQAKLTPRCDVCGCEAGYICEGTVCALPAPSFALAQLQVTQTAYTTKATPISLTIQNNSPGGVDAPYTVYLETLTSSKSLLKEFPQLVLLNIAPNSTQTVTFSVLLSPDTQFIRARLHTQGGPFNASSALATSSDVSVSVQEDTSPPAPPTQLAATSSQLVWNASVSSDVEKYLIYQQNTATGGFTTYSIVGETDDTSYPLSSPESLAYVVRAQDYAGNLSEPTSPVIASASN